MEKMDMKYTKTISDVHDATGIPRDGSGQHKIRNPLKEHFVDEEGKGWIKRGTHASAPFLLTEEFFEYFVAWLKNRNIE
jgi:hypothetical protein